MDPSNWFAASLMLCINIFLFNALTYLCWKHLRPTDSYKANDENACLMDGDGWAERQADRNTEVLIFSLIFYQPYRRHKRNHGLLRTAWLQIRLNKTCSAIWDLCHPPVKRTYVSKSYLLSSTEAGLHIWRWYSYIYPPVRLSTIRIKSVIKFGFLKLGNHPCASPDNKEHLQPR